MRFPRALHGTQSDVERQAVDVAKDWADDLRAQRALRPLDAVEVPPRTQVYCDPMADFAPMTAKWRLYQLGSLRVEVVDALDDRDRDEIRAVVERQLLELAAGALWFNVARPEPNTVPVVRARIDSLLVRWDELVRLDLYQRELHPQGLREIVEQQYAGLLLVWGRLDAESLPSRLRVAIARAADASADETLERMAQALATLAPREGQLRHPERFADRGWVVDQLAMAKPEGFDAAVTGHMVKRLLYALDQR